MRGSSQSSAPVLHALAFCACLAGCSQSDAPTPSGAARSDSGSIVPALDARADARAAPAGVRILSAFFGLDDALPARASAICPSAPGKDGMPVTFSRRLASLTTPSDAFVVRTQSGAIHVPVCASPLPATDPTERHTVLLFGDLGSAPTDPPVEVEVVGDLAFEGGGTARGARGRVTPLADGPFLVLGLDYAPGAIASTCPAAARQIVQVTWAGGVTPVGGGAFGERERLAHHVELAADAGPVAVTPIAFSDLGDNDNYVQLCLADAAPAIRVRVDAGILADPNGDANPATAVVVGTDPR